MADSTDLIGLYEFRYETLLQFIRVSVLVLSVIYIWLTIGANDEAIGRNKKGNQCPRFVCRT